MNINRVLALLSAFVLMLSLIGCRNVKNAGNNTSISDDSSSLEKTETNNSFIPDTNVTSSSNHAISESASSVQHTHSYSQIITEPTCTGKGYTTFTCDCGYSYKGNEVAAKGHVWEEWETIAQPEIGIPGTAQRCCIICGTQQSKEIDALPAATSGQCGDAVYWKLDSSGVLSISGTGAMWDYNESNLTNPTPWSRYTTLNNAKIVDIVINPGITHIGDFAFFGNSYVEKEIIIPDTVETIGRYAFDWSTGITSVIISKNIKYIGDFAFKNCFALTHVYFMGNNPELGENVFRSTTDLVY